MKKKRYIFLFIIATEFLIISLLVRFPPGNVTGYSIFNTNENGLSKFKKLILESSEVSPIVNPYTLTNLEDFNGTLIVIEPTIEFSDKEIEILRKFIIRGNTLLIAGRSNITSYVLERLGTNITLSNEDIITLTKNENGTSITKEVDIKIRFSNVESVYFNRARAIFGVSKNDVLVQTSNASKVEDKYGSFPIVAQVRYGKGYIIIVSDPDVFTNSLYEKNKSLLKMLISMHLQGSVFIDEFHHEKSNLMRNIIPRYLVRTNNVFYYAFLMGCSIVIIKNIRGLIMWSMNLALQIIHVIHDRDTSENLEEIIKQLKREGLEVNKLRRIAQELELHKKFEKLAGDTYGEWEKAYRTRTE